MFLYTKGWSHCSFTWIHTMGKNVILFKIWCFENPCCIMSSNSETDIQRQLWRTVWKRLASHILSSPSIVTDYLFHKKIKFLIMLFSFFPTSIWKQTKAKPIFLLLWIIFSLIIVLYFQETQQNPLLLFLDILPKISVFENASDYDRNATTNRLSEVEKGTMRSDCAKRQREEDSGSEIFIDILLCPFFF